MWICNHWCVINVIIEDYLLKLNRAIVVCLKRNKCYCKNSFVVYLKNGFILRILVASLMIPFWKQTVPLSFICVMGNGPMNYNSCWECFLRLTRILSLTLYWRLFRRIFLACYCYLFAIACVSECISSQQHAWCLRWRLVQILVATGMTVVLCDKLRGWQTWLRLGCLIMDCCWQC